MIQRGKDLGLSPEPGEALRIEREGSGQYLQRDVAAEVGIAGSIHLSHATGAEQPNHFVGTEALSGVQRHAGCESIATSNMYLSPVAAEIRSFQRVAQDSLDFFLPAS